MQGIYHQSLTGNQGQLGPFDPSIIIIESIQILGVIDEKEFDDCNNYCNDAFSDCMRRCKSVN
jgi:hypothetical protein